MATRAQKIKVGVFLVVCTAILGAGLLIVSGYRTGDKIPYWIEFNESVLGLNKGGTVEYLGVPVGEVDDIFVTESNTALVLVMVEPDKVTLRHGVKARLVLYSIATGTLYISLTGGDPDALALPPEAKIPTEPSVFESFRVQMEKALMSTSEITEALHRGLEGMEDGDLTRVVKKAEALITDGQEFLTTTEETVTIIKDETVAGIADSRKLAQDLRVLAKDADEFVKLAKEKIEPLEPAKTEQGWQGLVENLNALSEQLRETAETFEEVMRTVAHKVDNTEYSLRETFESMKDTLQEVRALVEYLEQDPAALIRGKGQPKGAE